MKPYTLNPERASASQEVAPPTEADHMQPCKRRDHTEQAKKCSTSTIEIARLPSRRVFVSFCVMSSVCVARIDNASYLLFIILPL